MMKIINNPDCLNNIKPNSTRTLTPQLPTNQISPPTLLSDSPTLKDLKDSFWGSYSVENQEDVSFLTSNQPSDEALIEKIFLADDRKIVRPTTQYPWSAICALLITTASQKKYLGTGWFIHPRVLVTAGHCVYLHEQPTPAWASSIEVIPACDGKNRPFQSVISLTFRATDDWIHQKKPEADYGLIILAEEYSEHSRIGHFGIHVLQQTTVSNTRYTLAGYPLDKSHLDLEFTQWFHELPLKKLDDTMLFYEIDTLGGQSGAPIWENRGNDQYYCIGLHTLGLHPANKGLRITPQIYQQIIQWLDELKL